MSLLSKRVFSAQVGPSNNKNGQNSLEMSFLNISGRAVRGCFPTSIMDTVKKYVCLGMKLKSAEKIVKFQVINRKGQPVFQTGDRNQSYSDYQGDRNTSGPRNFVRCL